MEAATTVNNADNRPVGLVLFIKELLRGTAQVMFQDKLWTGLFILTGIFWGAYAEGSGVVAWAAVVGLIVSTATGHILGFPREDGKIGLWGFNGILVGCAFMTFLSPTIWVWLAMILCSALTTWVRTAFNKIAGKLNVSSFTFPFVAMTWVFLMASRQMNAMPSMLPSPHFPGDLSPALSLGFGDLVTYWLKGISQVFLINSWVTGIFFLVGLFISNKWVGITTALSSAVALFVIIVMQGPGTEIANGIFGFSAVLTGIALAVTFNPLGWKSMIWALLGVIVTVFMQASMNVIFTPLGLPTLTGPFCIVTWLFLIPAINLAVKKKSA